MYISELSTSFISLVIESYKHEPICEKHIQRKLVTLWKASYKCLIMFVAILIDVKNAEDFDSELIFSEKLVKNGQN